MKTDAERPWNPFHSPIIKPSWHDRIRRGEYRPESRVYGRKLIGSCWLWTGWNNAKPGGEYGVVRVDGKRWYLHRYVHAKYWGIDLWSSDILDHLCRARLCFNPHHTERVDHHTNYENGNGVYGGYHDDISEEDIQGLLA